MRQHRLWYQSSYDRGVDVILKLWPKIKAKFPDATLDIAYGWNLFDTVFANNPERMAWKKKMVDLMVQDGIKEHGRLGKKELTELRKSCGVWVYPTYFTEIHCIGALEAQKDGLVPVTTTLAALNETVGSGIKIDGDIYDPDVKEEWLNGLFKIMSDVKLWELESKKAVEFAKTHTWEAKARQWPL